MKFRGDKEMLFLVIIDEQSSNWGEGGSDASEKN